VPPLALPDPPLSDGIVALRCWIAADVPAIVEACQDPEIPRWTLVPSPYGEADARAYLKRVADGWDADARATFAVVDAADHSALRGAAGLHAIEWDLRVADVGYWVAAPARGRGVATRAVELLAGWAFGTLGLERLELRAHEDNAASHAVARRAGFAPAEAPLVHRPECDHMPDIFFARLRGGSH
jgi:RimJ/RimL family protein N-acetyltransferase